MVKCQFSSGSMSAGVTDGISDVIWLPNALNDTLSLSLSGTNRIHQSVTFRDPPGRA
jgi:hypothetical protein